MKNWLFMCAILAPGIGWTQLPRFYISYGVHRAEYLNTDIRVKQPVYDRTLVFRKAGAHDQPDFEAYGSTDISIPQFQLSAGYRILPKLYLEGTLHHLKYKIDKGQPVQLEETLGGTTQTHMVNITDVMPKYEHSDGLNMVLLSVVRPFQPKTPGKWYSDFLLMARLGVGAPIAHSDNGIVSPQGIVEYNRPHFHLSGIGVMGGASLRYQLLTRMFAEMGYQPMAIRITDGLVYGGNSQHNIIGHQYWLSLGYTPKVSLRRRAGSN
ncbi:MAG: hypothetical protein KF690_09790 [Bacteroidetes bacterium]|nr:hypothetical protein [Bacteroidota bacterium]